MNTMTFTIESVHGVKQTFVLGRSNQAAANEATSNQQSTEVQQKMDVKDTSDAPRSPH
jgi:hypothetical protein